MYISGTEISEPPDLRPVGEMTDFQRGMYISAHQSIALERKLWKRTGLFSCVLVLFWVMLPVILMGLGGTLICQFAIPGGRSMAGSEALSRCNALGAYEIGIAYTLSNICIGVIGGFFARILFKRVYRRVKDHIRRHRMSAEEKREYYIRRRLRERERRHQWEADAEIGWLRRRQDAIDEARDNYYAKFRGYESNDDNFCSFPAPEIPIEPPMPVHTIPEIRVQDIPGPPPPQVGTNQAQRAEPPPPPPPPAPPYIPPSQQRQQSPPTDFSNPRTRQPEFNSRIPPLRDQVRGSEANRQRDGDIRGWEDPYFDSVSYETSFGTLHS